MNIVIAGCTCSGKTTLTREIINEYTFVSSMPQDKYFKDLNNIPKHKGRYLMDSINAFEYNEYQQDCLTLLSDGKVNIPRYDLTQNKRLTKDLLLLKKNLIVFEGLHTIKLLSEIPDALKIFLSVDLDECLRRRIERDSKKYGVEPKKIEEYFYECAIPMYREYIEPQKEKADIVIEEKEDAKWILKKYIKS